MDAIDDMKEVASFMRLKIAAWITLLTIVGILTTGKLSLEIITPTISILLCASASYALNNVTDTKEDELNKRPVSLYAKEKYLGLTLIGIAQSASILLALTINAQFVFANLLLFSTLSVYSILRLKRITLVKNAYTGFSVGLAFLAGVTVNIQFFDRLLFDYIFVSGYTAILSIIADIRDEEGDRAVKAMTLPVVIGKNMSKIIVSSLIVISMILTFLYLPKYFIIIPFMLLGIILIQLEKFKIAHASGAMGIVMLILQKALGF